MISGKIIGWIAIAVILFVMGWVYKSNVLTDHQLQAVTICILSIGVSQQVISRRFARLTVMRRRRMYKEFWRRIDREDMLNQPEEESIVLLGRIKGDKTTAILMTVGALGALYFGNNQFGLVLALGQMFLASKLYLIVRNIDKALPPDSERGLHDILLSEGTSNRFLVDINIRAFHDFIRPSNALPFWNLSEAEKWLSRCGFRLTSDGKWEASRDCLKFLDHEEIISLERV